MDKLSLLRMNAMEGPNVDPHESSISLYPQKKELNTYTPSHTDDLAAKYSSALGEASPGEDVVMSGIIEGNTRRFADLLAQKKSVELINTKNDIVRQIATARGGNPLPEDIEIVQALASEEAYSPDLDTILENEYARKVTELQATLLDEDNDVLSEAMASNPDMAMEVIDRSERQASRNMIASNLYSSLQNKFEQSGLLSQVWAVGQSLIPFRSWAAMNTFVEAPPFNSFWPGDSIRDQIAYLQTLPPDEFKKQLEAGVEKQMETGNYLDAMQFVEAVLSFSDSDAFQQTFWNGLDLATFVPVGALARGLKGAGKAAVAPLKDMKAMTVASGIEREAVQTSMGVALTERKLPSQVIANISDVETMLPSLFRPSEAFTGRALRAPGVPLSRLQEAAVGRAGKALEILTDVNRVERLTPDELEVALNEAEDFLETNFVTPSSQVIDFRRNNAEDSIGNVYSVTAVIGRKDGGAFPNKMSAGKLAKVIGLRTNDYQIVERGGGWVVEVSRNIDETSGGLRNLDIELDNKSPDNVFSRFTGYLLGSDMKLGKQQTTQRGVAVLSSERAAGLLEEFTRPWNVLSKGEKKDIEKFLEKARDHVDPKNGRGITYNTPFEFEDAYYQMFNKAPTYQQIDAYMAFKQYYDLDWIVRDLDVFKQKAILGVEKFSFKAGDKAVTFEGKEVKDLPRGSKTPFKFAVVADDGTIKKGDSFYSAYMKEDDWTRVNTLIADNYKVVQAYEGATEIGSDLYNFILVRNFKRDRVGMLNLNYKQGSRVMQKYPYFIKQPRVRLDNGRARYNGDQTLANARSADEANDILRHMEVARKMIVNRTPGVRRYFEENLPMWTLKKFLKASKDGTIDINIPFKVTKTGSRTVDSANIVEDLRKEGLTVNSFTTDDEFDLSRQVNGRFLGERDETNMAVYGSEKGKIFEVPDSPVLSPIEALRVSMSNMVDTHVIHDYRLSSSRNYTKEFADILDGDRSNFDTEGLSYIFEPRYRSGADPNKVKVAEGVRTSILSLFNNKTIVERQIDMYKEKLVRTVGKFAGDDVAKFVEDKALPMAQNADVAMRAFAFHTKMGFFNIRQFFLQSTAMVNVVAISPKHGIRGAQAVMPLTLASVSKKAFDKAIGKKTTMTGFSPDEFAEMADAYRRSGFSAVGGDVAYLDNLMPPKLHKSKLRKGIGEVLELGGSPFRGGERIARSMAYATAYSERKAATKGKPLSRADEAWILQRAKDMTGNMTRDSNAAYQRGYGAIVTQFFSYQMRLMEQMLSKKLTNGEKARLFTGMGLVYGFPVAAGMTVGVVPVREWLKDVLATEGISYDNTLAEPFMDGFAATMLETMSGMDLNVSEKFGPGGIPSFYDLLKGDADLSELLLGASGGIIGDTIKDFNPIIAGIWGSIDLNDQTNFPITVQDLIEPLRNISTVNNAVKLQEATSIGKWISQNENVLTDVTMMEGITSSILGLDPERVSDAFNQLEALSVRKDRQAALKKEMIADYKRGIIAMKQGDTVEASKYFGRVKSYGVRGDFTHNQMVDMYMQAASNEPLDESVLRSYEKYITEGK
jgi:hypothetical protein